MDSLEMDVDLMKADIVPLRKAPNNVGIVDIAIKYLKSVGRNLNVLSGHNYLILILLSCVVLLKVLHLLFLTLSRLYCRMRSMIGSDSYNSLIMIFQRLMHLLQVCTRILPPQKLGC